MLAEQENLELGLAISVSPHGFHGQQFQSRFLNKFPVSPTGLQVSEIFLLIMSTFAIGTAAWLGHSGKVSWKLAAKRGTASVLTLWLLSAAFFTYDLATTTNSNRVVMSDSYNPSSGGWFRIQLNNSRQAAAEGLVSSLAIALGLGVVGGILIRVAPDTAPKQEQS